MEGEEVGDPHCPAGQEVRWEQVEELFCAQWPNPPAHIVFSSSNYRDQEAADWLAGKDRRLRQVLGARWVGSPLQLCL